LPFRKVHAAYLCFLCWITLPALSAAQTLAEPAGEAIPWFEDYSASSFPESPLLESSFVAHSPTQKGTPKAAEPSAVPPVTQPGRTDEASTSPPLLHGFNAGITFAGIHDSVVGWSILATPTIGYSFNDIFSVDATLPIYMYRLAETLSAKPRRNQLLVNQRGELGDLILGLHAQFLPRFAQYQMTVAVTAPTGDEAYGLTTGRATFDLNNHFERTYGRLTPNIELGVGDSTTLVNRLVDKNYTSLGPLSHFQIGLGVELFRGMAFETDAYEQLPIGDQKIYGPSRKGRATVVIGHAVTEDNGFTNALEIPIDRHTFVSAYYSRSLRLRIDSVGFGVTYILRAPLPEPEISADDLFR
jgi:hypothetical protein